MALGTTEKPLGLDSIHQLVKQLVMEAETNMDVFYLKGVTVKGRIVCIELILEDFGQWSKGFEIMFDRLKLMSLMIGNSKQYCYYLLKGLMLLNVIQEIFNCF